MNQRAFYYYCCSVTIINIVISSLIYLPVYLLTFRNVTVNEELRWELQELTDAL